MQIAKEDAVLILKKWQSEVTPVYVRLFVGPVFTRLDGVVIDAADETLILRAADSQVIVKLIGATFVYEEPIEYEQTLKEFAEERGWYRV